MLVFMHSGLYAQSTWDGSSNDQWGTAANWTPSGVPGYAADIILDDTPGSNQNIKLGGSRQVNLISVDSQYDYEISPSSGWHNIVFVNGGAGVDYAGSGDFEISSKINIDTNPTFTNSGTGTMTISGDISNWSGTEVHFTGSGNTVFSGSLNGGIDLRVSGTGTNTFNGGNFSGGSELIIEGGTNIIDAGFGGGATVTINGGDTTITGGLGGGSTVEVNVASGGLTIEGNIGGGANISVDQGQLALSGNVGNGAGIDIQSGGTLLLEDGASLGNGSNVALSGGTLAVSGTDISIDNLTLTGDSTIDLNNDPTIQIDLGNISGSGTINIINYVDAQQVTYTPGGSTIDPTEQVLFYGNPAQVVNGDELVPGTPMTPVPEPGTVIGGGVLVLLAGAYLHTQRRKKLATTDPLVAA